MMDFKVEYMSVEWPSSDPTTNRYIKVPVVREGASRPDA